MSFKNDNTQAFVGGTGKTATRGAGSFVSTDDKRIITLAEKLIVPTLSVVKPTDEEQALFMENPYSARKNMVQKANNPYNAGTYQLSDAVGGIPLTPDMEEAMEDDLSGFLRNLDFRTLNWKESVDGWYYKTPVNNKNLSKTNSERFANFIEMHKGIKRIGIEQMQKNGITF